MSSAPLPDQHISGTSATHHSLAVAGSVHGNVDFHAHECQCTGAILPPKPYSTVPFRRDPDFVDRGDLLLRIDERCSQPAGRAALVGFGGVGKSQLAIEHAHRTRERSPETWVFWVHARNAARFEQGYKDIADAIKIAERKDPKVDIFKLVHDWLRGCERKWLIILDNVDDAGFLVDAQATTERQSSDSGRRTLRPLRDYLPQSQNGSILITTRNRESALKLSERNDLISIDPMDAVNAVELLDKKLSSTGQGNKKELTELAAVLEFMPLAIVQAASYISQLSPRYSVRQYIDDFQRSDRKKSSLLNHEERGLRRDSQAKNSIIITWQISFEHIRQIRQPAAELLSLMSFFDPQGIPEMLVRGRASDAKYTIHEGRDNNGKQSDENNDSELTDDGFEMDVRTLRDFSFISITSNPTIFEMHRLVQLAMRKWLDANDQLEKWKEQYVKILYEEMPNGKYENWAYCQVLFPHAKSAFTQRPKAKLSLQKWASLLYRTASYAIMKGSINDAVNLSETAMKVREKILGQEHKKTLQSMNLNGRIMIESGRWMEAEELIMQLTEISKRVLGEEHPDTLAYKAILASIYDFQGRQKEAEVLEREVIKIKEKVLGKEHPDTLISMFNLASTYHDQRRLKEAEELEREVIKMKEKVLGKEHPSTLTSMHNLAITWKDQGRSGKAIDLMDECVLLSTQVLGANHPDTLTSVAALTKWRRQESRTSHSAANDPATSEGEQGRLDETSHHDVSFSEPSKKSRFTSSQQKLRLR